MAYYKDLVAQFEAAYPSCSGDAYAFAEWLCDEREYFGPLEADTSDLESAWQQAMDWYLSAKDGGRS